MTGKVERKEREILLYAYPTVVISVPRPSLIPEDSHLLTLLHWGCIHTTLGFGRVLIPQPLKTSDTPRSSLDLCIIVDTLIVVLSIQQAVSDTKLEWINCIFYNLKYNNHANTIKNW